MKTFLYFEQEEGGMAVHEITCFENAPTNIDVNDQLGPQLYGWRNERCAKDDAALLRWTVTAEIGQYFDHRLGTMVRVLNNGECYDS